MKRWIARILVFLLLGAIANVAVAWGCAIWLLDGVDYRYGGGLVIASDGRPLNVTSISMHRAGWPCRSMSWRPLAELTTTEQERVPLRPIWPGFAINTVFYAAILWGLFAAPFALRRWRRIKLGLCPKCGYDLRGTPNANTCPECGTVTRDANQRS